MKKNIQLVKKMKRMQNAMIRFFVQKYKLVTKEKLKSKRFIFWINVIRYLILRKKGVKVFMINSFVNTLFKLEMEGIIDARNKLG